VQNKVAAKTKYEIFDSSGNIVKKGYNSSVDYSNLNPIIYHINFDNKRINLSKNNPIKSIKNRFRPSKSVFLV
jgi:hypothetical protein